MKNDSLTWTREEGYQPNLTMRDIIAAAALITMKRNACSLERQAQAAYELADAMLKAREAEGGGK